MEVEAGCRISYEVDRDDLRVPLSAGRALCTGSRHDGSHGNTAPGCSPDVGKGVWKGK